MLLKFAGGDSFQETGWNNMFLLALTEWYNVLPERTDTITFIHNIMLPFQLIILMGHTGNKLSRTFQRLLILVTFASSYWKIKMNSKGRWDVQSLQQVLQWTCQKGPKMEVDTRAVIWSHAWSTSVGSFWKLQLIIRFQNNKTGHSYAFTIYRIPMSYKFKKASVLNHSENNYLI